MRALLHVAARTLVERRNVLAAAAVAALLPLLAPLLPGTGSSPAADARGAAALIVGAGFALVVAVLHGATCVARDLRERRLSFYLARPLSASSLWFGRVLAGVLLSGATLLIAWLPTMVLDPTPSRDVSLPPGLVGSVLAILLAAVVLGHALAVMLASRSAWLAVDVAALATLATAAVLLLRTILGTGATKVFGYALWSTLAAVVVALVLAGLAQLAHGRSDARRGHRALSLALWGVLAAAVGLLGGYTVFLTHPSPASLQRIYEVELEATGTHIAFGGTPAWRGDSFARFILDTAGGSFVRTAPGSNLASEVSFARAGGAAFWLTYERGNRPHVAQLMRCDLGSPRPHPRRTAIAVTVDWTASLAVSADGTRVAIRHDELLSLFEVATGRLVTSARLPGGDRWALLDFTADGTLRVEQLVEDDHSGASRRAVLSFDTAGGPPRQTATLAFASVPRVTRHLDAARPFVLASYMHDSIIRTEVLDAWTGEQIADLGDRRAGAGPHLSMTRLAILADGRYAVTGTGQGTARLQLYSHEWEAERSFDLGPATSFAIGAELEPGSLPLVISKPTNEAPPGATSGDECLLLDLATGGITLLARDTRPLASVWWANGGRPVAPATPAARHFISDTGEVSTWDPATRRLRRVLRTRE